MRPSPASAPPTPPYPQRSYLYFVAIRRYFDTQELQTAIAYQHSGAPVLPEQHPARRYIKNLLAGNEVAVMHTEPADVLCAVELERQLLGPNWRSGLRVRVIPGSFRTNYRANVPNYLDTVNYIVNKLPTETFYASKPETDEELRLSGFR
jgi:hypothetical protein